MLHHRENPWVTRLTSYAELSSAEIDFLDELVADAKQFSANQMIVSHGDRRTSVPVILEGFAVREHMMEDGGRQITGCLVPGDACDLGAWDFPYHHDNLIALAPCTVAFVPCETLITTFTERPNLARALAHANHADMTLARSHIVSLGRRDATARMAHFLCELHMRLHLVGAVANNRFAFPFSQRLLADALGLSTVHVNRTLQNLRSNDLVVTMRGIIEIKDLQRLQRRGGFTSNILMRRDPDRVLPSLETS